MPIGRNIILKDDRDPFEMALERATSGDEEGLVIISRKEGLRLAAILEPPESMNPLRMMVLFSVPVANALEAEGFEGVELIWPNLISVMGDRLGEVEVARLPNGRAVLGINILLPSGEEDGTVPLEREGLANTMIFQLDAFYSRLTTNKVTFEEYVDRCSSIGRVIELRVGEQVIEGKVLNIEDSGTLVIRGKDGLYNFSLEEWASVRGL